MVLRRRMRPRSRQVLAIGLPRRLNPGSMQYGEWLTMAVRTGIIVRENVRTLTCPNADDTADFCVVRTRRFPLI